MSREQPRFSRPGRARDMLQLHARLRRREGEPSVLRLCEAVDVPDELRGHAALLARPGQELPAGFGAYILPAVAHSFPNRDDVWEVPEGMGYLKAGDIVRLNPRAGECSVLYRRASRFNAMLLTERCNSNCVMCSQPPKDALDDYLVDTYLSAIPLMDRATPELAITGGEPTLLGDRLLALIGACREHLPDTALHMLSNGRLFSYLSLCQSVSGVEHPNLLIGVPLYSDVAARHDFVVQASGAFDQTIRGLMNLERCGLRIEVRVVLHRHTVPRLPQLAEFIARNLPFVEHVALMGLEIMGYVRTNFDALWIDPYDYQQDLAEAVAILDARRMNVSIFNHQLCTLAPRLWPFARQSISDWKNEYLPECGGCAVRDQCGGFFSSSRARHSKHIHAISLTQECITER